MLLGVVLRGVGKAACHGGGSVDIVKKTCDESINVDGGVKY